MRREIQSKQQDTGYVPSELGGVFTIGKANAISITDVLGFVGFSLFKISQ